MKRFFSLVAVMLASMIVLSIGASHALAQAGIGIAPGIIRVDEPVFPGMYYKLPSLQVVNTGTVAGQYEIVLAPTANQEELQPDESYISFNPKSFQLAPGASQSISLSLNLPARAKPGDYLAFIEAHPVPAAEGGTSIGIAVATKLYFTIKSTNILMSLLYAIAGFFTSTAPYSYIVLGVIVLGIIIFFLRRNIRLEVRLGHK
jgi:hypothetical protein